MDTGFYRYDALTHAIERLHPADIRLGLSNSANKNAALRDASCVIIITTAKASLRTRSRPVANLEAGQVAHAMSLQAYGFGLGTLPVGVFDDKFVSRQARFSANEEPVLLVAVGYPVGGIPAPVTPIQQPAAAAAVQKQPGKGAVVVVPETFQDEELTALLDIFSVANIPLRIAGPQVGELRGVHDSRANATLRIADVDPRNFDAVVYVGGPGMVDMYKDADLQALAVRTFNSNKLLAGIGEACTVFANAALIPKSRVLEQERTSNFKMNPGQTYAIPGVQNEGGIITASGINNSTLFARTIADTLRGVTPAEGIDQQQVQRNQIFRPRKAGQANRPAQQ
jgi:protease I